mgnify:CR=1 FL=1
MGALFCDLSKAFDCLSVELLIRKLASYHIVGSELNLLTSYLSNRCQSVALENDHSNDLEIHSGLSQGSVLGPILLLNYINGIHSAFPGGGLVL